MAWNIKARLGECRFVIPGKKRNNELTLYVKRTKIESRHEVLLLEITFCEECNFKKYIENICHVAKCNLSWQLRVSE